MWGEEWRIRQILRLLSIELEIIIILILEGGGDKGGGDGIVEVFCMHKHRNEFHAKSSREHSLHEISPKIDTKKIKRTVENPLLRAKRMNMGVEIMPFPATWCRRVTLSRK